MRGELKLSSYTFESVAAAVLRLRVPLVPQAQMAAWFDAGHAGAPGARTPRPRGQYQAAPEPLPTALDAATPAIRPASMPALHAPSTPIDRQTRRRPHHRAWP